jgi:hypothetical protein
VAFRLLQHGFDRHLAHPSGCRLPPGAGGSGIRPRSRVRQSRIGASHIFLIAVSGTEPEKMTDVGFGADPAGIRGNSVPPPPRFLGRGGFLQLP